MAPKRIVDSVQIWGMGNTSANCSEGEDKTDE